MNERRQQLRLHNPPSTRSTFISHLRLPSRASGATRSFTTQVPAGSFRPGTRVPGYPSTWFATCLCGQNCLKVPPQTLQIREHCSAIYLLGLRLQRLQQSSSTCDDHKTSAIKSPGTRVPVYSTRIAACLCGPHARRYLQRPVVHASDSTQHCYYLRTTFSSATPDIGTYCICLHLLGCFIFSFVL